MLARRLRSLRPSRELREFLILSALSETERITQRAIAQAALMSSTMVNQYLAEMVARDWVEIEGETNRTYRYRLTPAGVFRRNELLRLLTTEAVQFYGMIKAAYRRRVAELVGQGLRRLVIFGAAETGEIVARVAEEAGAEIVAVWDTDPAKAGHRLGAVPITPPMSLEPSAADAVLICSHGHAEEMRAQVGEWEARGGRVVIV